MARKGTGIAASIDAFREMEEKLPILAQTRYRENEVERDPSLRPEVFSVYRRVIRNNVLMDARMFVESLLRRELTRPEADKVARIVGAYLERFLREASGD